MPQAEDLESPAIGQHGSIPVHEGVQAAKFLDQLRAGAQHEVVSVGEYDLRAGPT
jgi:hypothetical protein